MLAHYRYHSLKKMKLALRDFFEAWNKCELSTQALLKKCQDCGHLRLSDTIVEHEAGHVSLMRLMQVYTESTQVHGLLDTALMHPKRASRLLALTLWPSKRVHHTPVEHVGELVRVARHIYERDGFEAMKNWMEGELFCMSGVRFLTEEEQLKSVARMYQTSASKMSVELMAAAIRDQEPVMDKWIKMDASSSSFMGVLMKFFLAGEAGLYVWRNSDDGSAVSCHYESASQSFIFNDYNTGQTHTVSRADGPDMLLTSGVIPGMQGNWTLYRFISPATREQQQQQQNEAPKLPTEPAATEPVLKKAKTNKKKPLAVPVLEPCKEEPV
jgi:hypothetical protein